MKARILLLIPLLAVWLTALVDVVIGQFPDPDLWGRLSIAALYFQSGQFPYQDPFSYTAYGHPWVDHEWLTGMVLYQIITVFGETGLLVFKYGMILAVFALLFCLHRKVYRASPLYAFYGLLLLFPVCNIGLYATVRSHIFSFFFFVLFVYLLERARGKGEEPGWGKPSLLWLLPLIGIIWGNLHGGFIMGVLLIGCYAIGSMTHARSLKAGLPYGVLAVSILLGVGLVNPYGLKYLAFLWHAWTLDRSHVAEWSMMRFGSWDFLPGQLLLGGSAILVCLRWLIRDKSDRLNHLLVPTLVLFWIAAMSIKSVRFQPFLAWTAVAYAPVLLAPDFFRRLAPASMGAFIQNRVALFGLVVPTLIGLSALGQLLYLHLQPGTDIFRVVLWDEMTPPERGKTAVRYPLGALRFLQESPYRGNLVIRYGLGEFAYWRLYPRFKVSMDGRYEEVYSREAFIRNHEFFDRTKFLTSQRRFEDFDKSPANFILSEAGMPHLALLEASPRWKFLYGDDYFLLYGRVSTLEKFPPFSKPSGMFITTEILTIQDMVRPEDYRRFRKYPF